MTEAIPFLIPIVVFVAIGLAVKIATLRYLKRMRHEDNGSTRG